MFQVTVYDNKGLFIKFTVDRLRQVFGKDKTKPISLYFATSDGSHSLCVTRKHVHLYTNLDGKRDLYYNVKVK